MWLTRNEAIHNRQDSHYNKAKHKELDEEIGALYTRLPKSLRVFPQSDAAFFLNSKDKVKHYRLRKKIQWLKDATCLHNTFLGNLSPEADNFLDYFDGTA